MKKLLVIAKPETEDTIILSVPKNINPNTLGLILNKAINDLHDTYMSGKLTGEVDILSYSSKEIDEITASNTIPQIVRKVINRIGNPNDKSDWNSKFWQHINDTDVVEMLKIIRDNQNAGVLSILKFYDLDWLVGYINNVYRK